MMFKNSKKADIEIDEVGKIIIGLVLLLILIAIITVVIKGELFSAGSRVLNAFKFFG